MENASFWTTICEQLLNVEGAAGFGEFSVHWDLGRTTLDLTVRGRDGIVLFNLFIPYKEANELLSKLSSAVITYGKRTT